MEKSSNNNNFIENLKSNFPIIIFFVGMAVTWGVFQTRIANLEVRLTAAELKQNSNDQVLTQMQVNIGEIKTSLEFIKDKI